MFGGAFASTVNLKWYSNGQQVNNPVQCVYDTTGTVATIAPPAARPGYIFEGWLVTGWQAPDSVCNLFSVEVQQNGKNSLRGYLNVDGGADMNTERYGLTENGTWGATFPYGVVTGLARCSPTSGTDYESGNPVNDPVNGEHCWCKLTKYTASNGDVYESSCFRWIYEHSYGSMCKRDCADFCAWRMTNNFNFRTAMFTQSQ